VFDTSNPELAEKQKQLAYAIAISADKHLSAESRNRALDHLAGNEIRNVEILANEIRNADAIDTTTGQMVDAKPVKVEQRDQVAPVETRAHIEAEQRSAIAANPIGVPSGEKRANAGTLLGAEVRAISGASGLGAAFTPAENAGFAIDFLSKNAVFLRSGVQVIRTAGDSIVIPHLTSDGTASTVAEGSALPSSDPVAEALTAVPRKFAQTALVGNETLADSKPSALEALGNSLVRGVGLAYDLAAFEGNGTSPNVRGLKNVSGIQTFFVGVNGAALASLDPIADALGMLAEQNANDEGAVIVMPPRTWRAIMKLKEASGSNKSLVQDSSGSASGGVVRALFGRPVFLSGNLSLTEAQGTSGNVASSIYVYDPAQIYAVIREDTVFDVNPYQYGSTDQTLVRALMRADVLVPNPTAVVRITGVL
jgi:HK97 family phage major capsid protein